MTDDKMERDIWDINDVADYLGLSTEAVYKKHHSRELRARRFTVLPAEHPKGPSYRYQWKKGDVIAHRKEMEEGYKSGTRTGRPPARWSEQIEQWKKDGEKEADLALA